MSEKDINRSIELCKRVVTTESFIAEAKEIYGDRYDYSKVNYKNKEHRVTIVCPIHGEFQVYAREHLDGKGCPKCEKGEKFIAKLKEKFGDKFGLDEFVYESSTAPVTLICPTHGAFSRHPHQILNAPLGCPECGNELLNQRRVQARLDALEHKEERDQARKERQLARREAKKIAEEEAAKEKWEKRIQRIIDIGQQEREECVLDLFKENSDSSWYEDFFGFNLKSFCLDDGTIVNDRMHIFIPIIHRPFYELKIEANQAQGEMSVDSPHSA